jgi:hypothetical protein
MELFYLSIKNSSEKKPFELTYGLHKELQDYLLSNDRLFNLFTDVKISDTVLKIALSERNSKGQVIKEFEDFDLLDTDETIVLLDQLYDHFSNFF